MTEPDFDTIPILVGAHDTRDDGVCALELVAWMADEPHSDSPACTCPVLAAFVRSWNDGIADDETRARLLRPFLPRLIGARSTPEIEDRRAWLATDWLVRVCAPAFLTLTPSLREHAEILSGLPPVLSRKSARSAQDMLAAAGDAARDALAETVATQQSSATDLLDRMIEVSP
jgi:hypothetical protein